MTSASASDRFQRLPAMKGDWVTLVVELPLDAVAQVCVSFEGYDNVAMVRTPDAQVNQVFVYTWEGYLPIVRQILTELSMDVPVRVIDTVPGMKKIAGNW